MAMTALVTGSRGGTRLPVRLALVVALVVAVAPLLLIGKGVPNLYDSPIAEDGWYSQTVARNIASGDGFTIDGSRTTNGVQPLATVVDAVVYLGHPSTEVSIRLLMALNWAVFVAFAATIGVIARDAIATRSDTSSRRFWFLVAFSIALSSQFVAQMAFNGMETGVLLLGYALIGRFLQVRELRTTTDAVLLGALLGLLALVRVDSVLFCIAVVVWMAFLRGRDRSPVRAATVAVVAFVVSSPWWIYGVVEFGHLVPISGRSESAIGFGPVRVERIIEAMTKTLTPWVYTGGKDSVALAVVQFAVFAVVAVIGVRAWRSLDPSGDGASGRARLQSFVGLLVATWSMLAIVYMCTSKMPVFWWRYLAMGSILSIGLTIMAFAWLFGRSRAVACVMLCLVAPWSFVLPIRLWSQRGNELLRDQVSLVRQYVPAGETVGAFQTGTLGFFVPDVRNLDGKVDPDALDARGRTGSYLREKGIEWFADWDIYRDQILTGDPAIDDRWVLVARRGRTGLWHYDSSPANLRLSDSASATTSAP